MKKQFTLPYGIDFAIDQNLQAVKKYKAPHGYYMDCPFCGGKRKLNVHQGKSVFRCAKCDTSGNTITFHAKSLGIDNKSAREDLDKRFKGIPSSKKANYKFIEFEPQKTPFPIDVRNVVYNDLLKQLSLSDKHHEDLIKRGLTEEQIIKNGYKTTPLNELQKIGGIACEFVEGATKGEYGIPGFYDIDTLGAKMVKRKNGFLIPCRTFDGLISGFQIRNDELPDNATKEQKEHFHKYSWLTSTEKESGCSFTGCENIHFAGDWSNVPKKINLTEGLLKADIASALTGKPFLGLSGVNNLSQLEERLVFLKSKGVEMVNICVDMDYREKKEVQKAMENIEKIISKAGLKYSVIKWDEKYKGIDDFLLARKNKEEAK